MPSPKSSKIELHCFGLTTEKGLVTAPIDHAHPKKVEALTFATRSEAEEYAGKGERVVKLRVVYEQV